MGIFLALFHHQIIEEAVIYEANFLALFTVFELLTSFLKARLMMIVQYIQIIIIQYHVIYHILIALSLRVVVVLFLDVFQLHEPFFAVVIFLQEFIIFT